MAFLEWHKLTTKHRGVGGVSLVGVCVQSYHTCKPSLVCYVVYGSAGGVFGRCELETLVEL